MPRPSTSSKRVTLSRWQLELFVKCPRCFWLLKRHDVKPPQGYPLALNTTMDLLLKAEFDVYRAKGQPHSILIRHRLEASLFPDLEQLQEWRNPFRGLRWSEPASGDTLYGAVDDILVLPDGALAVLDYKSSGAKEITVYPSYQLQMDVYTFLLQRMGHRTGPQAFFAFFIAVKDEGFEGQLPFRSELVAVDPKPERVLPLFHDAARLARADEAPKPGAECDHCRWFDQAAPILCQ